MTSRDGARARATAALQKAVAAASAAAAEGIRRATDPAGQDACFVKPRPAQPEIRAPQPAPERRSSQEITPEQAERAAAPLIRAAQKLAQPAAPESAGDQNAAAQR